MSIKAVAAVATNDKAAIALHDAISRLALVVLGLRPIGECPSAGSLNACAFDQAECKVGINSGFSANHGFGRFWVPLSRGTARGGLNFSFFLAGPLRPVLCHPK